MLMFKLRCLLERKLHAFPRISNHIKAGHQYVYPHIHFDLANKGRCNHDWSVCESLFVEDPKTGQVSSKTSSWHSSVGHETFPVVTVFWLRKSWKQLQQKSQFSDCNLDKNFTEQYPKVDDSLPSDFKILDNYRQKYLKINEVDGTDHEEVEFFHAKSVQGEEERNLVNKDESRD